MALEQNSEIYMKLPVEVAANERGGTKFNTALGCFALVGVATLASGTNLVDFDLRDLFGGGGKSDPSPRGSVVYEGQHLETVGDDFVIKVGEGQAIVSMKAIQKYDKPGWLINGDFVNTNGTIQVRDPEDRDQPAKLRYRTEYCADGQVSVTEEVTTQQQASERDENGNIIRSPKTDEVVRKEVTNREVELDLGDIYVCDVEFINDSGPDAEYNAAAIDDDKVPPEIQREFQPFVIGAGATMVKAAECPADLDYFRSPEYSAFTREKLAEKYDTPFEDVTLKGGKKGTTSIEMQRQLGQELESYLNKVDPKTGERHKALDIQISGNNPDGLAASCYLDTSGVPVDSLGKLRVSQP